MALNIKNAEVQALATELAQLRKISITQAVLEAVRRELAFEKRRCRKIRLADELIEIGRRCAAHVGGDVSSADHAAILYDDRGLPR